MKGVILAGGAGTRLYPVTLGVSKQLLPVYNKPMIYYPLTVLMMAGIRDILLISTPHDLPRFKELFRGSQKWGIRLSFAEQDRPRGLADAFIVGRDFIGEDGVALVLGDNLFFGHGLPDAVARAAARKNGATVFVHPVATPERYGIATLDANGRIAALIEKPKVSPSNMAVTGLYFYDNRVVDIAAKLRPSARGEIEITDVNIAYLEAGDLHAEVLGRGFAWFDTGTHDSLLEASEFIRTIEHRQGLKIGSPEETAWRFGLIDDAQLETLVQPILASEYGAYLNSLLKRN
ncbi:glucose-1-phosphate thymidylyltransferase RfbA [Bradyrhizobium sp. sGM-13]|uniref:glucose-1-phosphate thymidylyltransferase RfbA n=1 Tax=Bradyrhizobium sp. sGM-13 TaxID=2831781 RepID=UPI001BCCE634|nr:glucose-1-phosphate thymidylyltransferase RfbA [Bradyrhizobium sp. sGM-13]